MHCLTVLEPWAYAISDLSLLAPTPKNVENRGTTFPRFCGPLLIHSGKGNKYAGQWLEHKIFIRARSGVRELWIPEFGEIAGRGIVAYVEHAETFTLAQVDKLLAPGLIPLEKVGNRPFDWQSAKRWSEGPVCLLLAGVCPLETPIPYRGQQGLFQVPDSLVADAVEAARERAAIRAFGGG